MKLLNKVLWFSFVVLLFVTVILPQVKAQAASSIEDVVLNDAEKAAVDAALGRGPTIPTGQLPSNLVRGASNRLNGRNLADPRSAVESGQGVVEKAAKGGQVPVTNSAGGHSTEHAMKKGQKVVVGRVTMPANENVFAGMLERLKAQSQMRIAPLSVDETVAAIASPDGKSLEFAVVVKPGETSKDVAKELQKVVEETKAEIKKETGGEARIFAGVSQTSDELSGTAEQKVAEMQEQAAVTAELIKIQQIGFSTEMTVEQSQTLKKLLDTYTPTQGELVEVMEKYKDVVANMPKQLKERLIGERIPDKVDYKPLAEAYENALAEVDRLQSEIANGRQPSEMEMAELKKKLALLSQELEFAETKVGVTAPTAVQPSQVLSREPIKVKAPQEDVIVTAPELDAPKVVMFVIVILLLLFVGYYVVYTPRF